MELWCPSAIERAMERPMPKPLPFLCASALALSLTACAGTINNSTADTASNVTFTFTDSGVTAAGETDTGYEIDGTALTITSSGTYTVSGSCADGSIKVKKGTTGVTLVLDGLTLTSENTAAITCGKSSEVTILVSNGTENSLSDTEQNNDDNYPENENAENAVIKCKDGSTVTLCGDGELTVTANGKNGIKSGATTDEDGEALLTIRDLTLNIDAPVNDAINAEQLLNVESGTLTIDAAGDAIHCDLVLNISADGTDGPTIDITNCCEGLEGAELNVCSGDITINASDDCLNAANSDLTDYDFTMTISGGTIDAYSSAGDGFDSNGDLTITGGTVIVWTANTVDNEPLDADGTITVSGGTVLAAGGSSGMGMNLEAAQPCVIYGSTGFGGMPGSTQSSLIAADADFTIEDADGNAVYSGTARCGANFILFSSADVVADSAYTLKAGDSSTEGTAQSGTVSTGMGMGGGFAGQIIAQCAKRKGAHRVVVVDVLEGKLALARSLGADITLNPGQDNVIEAVKDLTNGLGADVVVEAAGTAESFNTASENIKHNGKVTLNISRWHDDGLEFINTCLVHHTWLQRYVWCPEALRPVAQGLVEVRPLITDEFKLDDIKAGFDLADKDDAAIKIVFRP